MPARGTRRSAVDLFWKKVDRSGSCWLWTASVDKDGYGIFSVTLPPDGGPARQHHTRGHRFSWEMLHGPVPRGMMVMHSCDTPRCVNPAHLSLGTALDNNGDAATKGRTAHGERNGHAKLTPAAVLEIRSSEDTADSLAPRFGVSVSTISAIRSGRTWRRGPAATRPTQEATR